LRGLLRPLILRTLLRDMRAGFEALNLAVKRVAEAGTAGDGYSA
jgi:hypothetical protein